METENHDEEGSMEKNNRKEEEVVADVQVDGGGGGEDEEHLYGFPRSVTNQSIDQLTEQQQQNGKSRSRSEGENNTEAEESLEQQNEETETCSSRSQKQSMGEESTTFDEICYLGSAPICEATNEKAAIDVIRQLLSANQEGAVQVALAVPKHSQGVVRLLDAEGKEELLSFAMCRIRFCARGKEEADGTESCFGFTFVRLVTPPNTPPAQHECRCHAFKCANTDIAGRILLSFARSFRNVHLANNNFSASSSSTLALEEDFQFELFLEIKEKRCFKLRRGRERRVVVVLQQKNSPPSRPLAVQKCFGLLLAAGRNLAQSDMHLLDMLGKKILRQLQQSMGRGQDNRVYVIEAIWDPNLPQFEVLNTETPRDTRVFMTVAVDVILSGIDEPVRFMVECKCRVFHRDERFWYTTRRSLIEFYFLTVRKCCTASEERVCVAQLESGSERERKAAVRLSLVTGTNQQTWHLPNAENKKPSQLIHPADDDESDSEEPLLSGTGEVSKECPEELLAEWAACLAQWNSSESNKRPRQLNGLLLKGGIPQLLRTEVWRLLAGCSERDAFDMTDTYRLLLAKESRQEQVILRDIHRTYPGQQFYAEAEGEGQETLFKICKAYALYDEEIAYCQGLSFLVAPLALNMAEEQAFCLLLKVMFDYGLRDLFKQGFDVLHLRFYQLDRLIWDYLPDLAQHFAEVGVETHMYASQWFLTLFTAKFPLPMVYNILDLFLSEGMNTIFHVSLALLKGSRKDLLQIDFEGALKYFRVVLPRKYMIGANADDLIQQAIKLKISHKRLAKYEKEYYLMKQKEVESQDPLERLERENLRQKETILRLERENDDLAHELVTSKIDLRNKLDAAEDSVETLQSQLERETRQSKDLEEENRNLHLEYDQVRNMMREELERLEESDRRSLSIISNYKQICSDLSHRLERQQQTFLDEKEALKKLLAPCENCSTLLETSWPSVGQSSAGQPNGPCSAVSSSLEELELELAQTKLALVESQCRNQDLIHQLNSQQQPVQQAPQKSNGWLKKALSQVKETAAAKSATASASASAMLQSYGGTGGSLGPYDLASQLHQA